LSFLAALVCFEFGSCALARSCSWTNARRGEKIYRMVAAIIGLKFLTIGHRAHCAPLRGRLIPFNSNSPTGSTFTAFSTFVSTRGLIKICPGLASSHSREATFDTVPMAA
jgi:hypothetical protein